MAHQLAGRTVAILAANGVEEVELVEPRDAVQAAGAQTEVLSISSGEIQAMNHDVSRVFAMLGVRARAQAVVLAYETGLVTAGAETSSASSSRVGPSGTGGRQPLA